MQIAHDLFEREQDRRDRRIERRSQRRGTTRRHERLHLFRIEPQVARDYRGESGAHLHRRSFAPERNSAGKRGRAAEELPKHRSKQDSSVVDEECELRLRDSAASRKREIAPQKIARAERTEHRNENPPPARSSCRIHTGREPSGQQDKRDYDQADQRADHQAENKRQLVFALSKSFQAPAEHGNPGWSLVAIHRLVRLREATGTTFDAVTQRGRENETLAAPNDESLPNIHYRPHARYARILTARRNGTLAQADEARMQEVLRGTVWWQGR